MTELKNVTKWCEQYSEKTKLKIFPQSAPVLTIIDDLMGVMERDHLRLIEISRAIRDINTQIAHVIELTKTNQKIDKKEVKK